MKNIFKKLGSFFLDTIQTVVLALSIFVIVYLFLLQPHQVKGNSMHPNFQNNEFLLTDKISYRFGEPQRGDVIVFKAPSSEPCAADECEYIKRIIALPNERVKIENNQIFIDGRRLIENYLDESLKTSPGDIFQGGGEIIIPPDTYLVLGDNRPYSRDGREFGFIEREAILGKAWFRYWPFTQIGLIPRANYNI
jgi:signal peptidase I